VLDRGKVEIKQVRSVRKEPFSDREIRELLRSVSTVIISKGKKSTKFAARDVKPPDLKGPTGNYRSPMVRKGKTLLVGFNQEALEQLV
jgi:arsenate reductase-like glutaredoxin family protein